MALVAYSDSEGSEPEDQPKPIVKATSQPSKNQTAAGFAINKSNPRKIQVSLGGLAAAPSNRDEDGEPTPKRAKVGSSGLGGFNAMLPAPKRGNEKKPTSDGSTPKVFSLKTGAEPGFSRESDAELRQLFSEQPLTSHSNGTSASIGGDEETSSPNPDPQKIGNPMRFRPLSVARKSKKKNLMDVTRPKKAAMPTSNAPAPSLAATIPVSKPPKISLFSAGPDTALAASHISNYNTADMDENDGLETEEIDQAYDVPADSNHQEPLVALPQAQLLDTIASDLNLSAADRRRLFGREGKGSNSAINIVNFNTDQEYAANEALRASGEQVQHHAVRGIAPGKHSLKQLVNAATTNKDALEESFAAGKSNKREAGNRYGW